MNGLEGRQRSDWVGWTLGAVLAGGRSRRFGAEKALARVAGIPLIARAAAVVAGAVPRAVAITSDPEVARAAGLDWRADLRPGGGPLGGLVTGLEWAVELGATGLLGVGGDMPFLTEGALRRLLAVAARPACVPSSSDGRRLQPLCAWYSVELLPLANRRLRAGDLSLRGLLLEAGARQVSDVTIAGELTPDIVFMNVNTRTNLARAEATATRLREYRV